jgi:hypothetical protein
MKMSVICLEPMQFKTWKTKTITLCECDLLWLCFCSICDSVMNMVLPLVLKSCGAGCISRYISFHNCKLFVFFVTCMLKYFTISICNRKKKKFIFFFFLFCIMKVLRSLSQRIFLKFFFFITTIFFFSVVMILIKDSTANRT